MRGGRVKGDEGRKDRMVGVRIEVYRPWVASYGAVRAGSLIGKDFCAHDNVSPVRMPSTITRGGLSQRTPLGLASGYAGS